MTKLISAKKILDEKGFVMNKFDTSAFFDVVQNFFKKNDVSIDLTLVPYRFVLARKYNEFDLTEEDIKRGFLPQCDTDERGELLWALKLADDDYESFIQQAKKGLITHRIIVDRPFIQNAAFMLQTMGGFVVEKVKLSKMQCYVVTLV